MTVARSDSPEQTRLLSLAPLMLMVSLSLAPSFITVFGPAATADQTEALLMAARAGALP